MTEHVQEQISAFIDDELSSEECAFLARRLGSDSEARAQLVRYAAIGSALRGEAVLANSALLRGRVHAAIEGTPIPPARRDVFGRRTRRRWLYSVGGAGMAACVAVAALFVLRVTLDEGVGTVPPVRAGFDGLGATPRTTASYVVPSETSEPRLIAPPIRLTNYLVQHGNYTSTLQRTSVHSNVVGIAKPEPATADFQDPATSER